jgi:zinc protease
MEPKSQTQISFGGPAASTTLQERYAIAALREVLNIRLRERLREDLGGTYSASVSGGMSRVPRPEYAVTISFGSAPDRAEQLVKAVFEEIAAVKAAGASDSVIAKVKEIQTRERETSLKLNGFWAGQIASKDQLGEPLGDVLAYDKLVQGLTSDLVKQAAQRYLDEKNYVRVSLFPENFKPGEKK